MKVTAGWEALSRACEAPIKALKACRGRARKCKALARALTGKLNKTISVSKLRRGAMTLK